MFCDDEVSRQSNVELKNTWTLHIVQAEIAVCAERGHLESGRVKPVVDTLIGGIRIGVYQARRLTRYRTQRAIGTGQYREKLSGFDLQNRRDLPIAGENPQRPVFEPRGCRN